LTAEPVAAATARPRDLVRIATAGSVDDGKSTLIGRLLHDSRAIADDQLAALERATRRRGADGLDLAPGAIRSPCGECTRRRGLVVLRVVTRRTERRRALSGWWLDATTALRQRDEPARPVPTPETAARRQAIRSGRGRERR
jgi:hypothetical protein